MQAAGHDVGSHGYAHQTIYKQTPDEFAEDLRRSLEVIEGITGEKVLGFRAPFVFRDETFSMGDRHLAIFWARLRLERVSHPARHLWYSSVRRVIPIRLLPDLGNSQ